MAATMLSSALRSAAAFTSAKPQAQRLRAGPVQAGLASPPPSGGVREYAKTLPGISDPFPEIFDPANLLERAEGSARPEAELKRWREAEVTHGRVAMLAALGFVVGEQLENYPAFLNVDGHVQGPAINHFQQVEARGAIFWEPLVFAIGLCEAYRVSVGWENPTGGSGFNALREDYAPGELGFDPLGLCPPDGSQEKYDMQTKELNNGRLAMIGIAGFVAQELVDKQEIFDRLAGGSPPEVIKNTS